MRKKMMDILACPADKHFPLELFESEAAGDEVVQGALYCTGCSRFYPILEGIPVLLPDDLRDKKRDLEFLRGNTGTLPEKITAGALPWHL